MYIGIDLGGTNIAAGLVDAKGRMLFKHSVPTDSKRGALAVIESMIELVKTIRKSAPVDAEITGVGIGIPGIADPSTGVVLACVNLGWFDVPLKDMMSQSIDLPIYIGNDATVAAVAEFEVAQKGQYKDAVMITLGTGVGGGVMVGGHMLSGHHGIGSEIGHMKVGEGLYTCGCGGNGCLETFCSSTAIIHFAKHLMTTTNQRTLLTELSDGQMEAIDGAMIFKAARAGDALAQMVVDRMVKYLSIGIINVVSLLDPQAVFIGGGLSGAGDYFLDKVKETVETLKYFKGSPCASIEIAQFKNDAGIIGAALFAKLEQTQ